jgi:NADPH:quinone reductase-like Zn-dependent oxidoreductase
MRQIWVTRTGPPEVLEVREAPDPAAGPGEVRVRVRAVGVNFGDLMARMGVYPGAPKIPCVVGYEAAGVVDQVGADVTDFVAGQRVIVVPRFGGYADTIVVPAGQTFALPDGMSFEHAGGFAVAYLTAHHALLFTGPLREGAHVLVHSAAGGVGLAAVQLARSRGGVVIGAASPSKHAFLREQGCQHAIDSSGDYAAQVRAIVGARGLDVVLDATGGASLRTSYELLRPAGRLVTYGGNAFTPGRRRSVVAVARSFLATPRFSALDLMQHNKTVTGMDLGHLYDHLDLLRPQFASLVELYRSGALRPHVDRSFRFDEAPAAHHYLHDRKARGKIVLVP